MAMEDLTVRNVPPVETKYRRIVTPIPVPESIPTLESMLKNESLAMAGQPPILWDRAEGFQVYDRFGNKWIDWTSGVLVTNAGHCHPKVQKAIIDQASHGLLHAFTFPTELRAKFSEKLVSVAPEGLDKTYLFTTGSEAVEGALKFARTYAQNIAGADKNIVVSFTNSFHGRTLGSQLAGGIPELKTWIVNRDPDNVQIPFPDGFRCPDTRFDLFLDTLEAAGVSPNRVAAVITESYQGGNASFAPVEYMQKVRAWCDQYQAPLIFDEVQAGFGRAGTYWAHEHYGVKPDLITCGKGISCGLPLSAVVGRGEIMDVYPPASMTATHTGNPICLAAAHANLLAIEEDELVENSRRLGEILHTELERIKNKFSDRVGALHGKGLVAALHIIKPGGIEPDPQLTNEIVRHCIEKGLMLFAPVGYHGSSVKVCPPLMIEEEALRESIEVLEEAMTEAIGLS